MNSGEFKQCCSGHTDMLLEDATRDASVEIFLRNLSFPFRSRGHVGFPDGLVGLSEPDPSGELACLIHELEHITQLTHSLGPIITALGLRAIDLHNNMVRTFNDMRKDRGRDVVDVGIAAIESLNFSFLLMLTGEFFTPLLEGLALFSEMEHEPIEEETFSASAGSAFLLELSIVTHRMQLTLREDALRMSKDAEEIAAFTETLTRMFSRQLASSRQHRKDSGLARSLFWGEGNASEDMRHEPYLLGYFYVRRLESEWRKKVPGLSRSEFLKLATRLICDAFPRNLLSVFQGAKFRGVDEHDCILNIFQLLLEIALLLPREEIEKLRCNDIFGLYLRATPPQICSTPCTELEKEEDHNSNSDWLFEEILLSIFNTDKSNDSRVAETYELLYRTERSKFLVRIGQCPVRLVGFDCDFPALFLIDASRPICSGDRSSGLTYLEMSKEGIDLLWRKTGVDPRKLNKLVVGRLPDTLHLDEAAPTFTIITYLRFWPKGLPAPGDDNVKPVEVVHVLFDERRGEAFLPDPTDADLASCLAFRDHMNKQFLPAVVKALDPGFKVTCDVLLGGLLRASNALEETVLSNYLTRLESSWISTVLQRCRGVYRELLFPCKKKSGKRSNSEKSSYVLLRGLAKSLAHDDLAVLNRWLKDGLILHPNGVISLETSLAIKEAKDVAGRISRAAIRHLGIPLVECTEDGTILLQLSPSDSPLSSI